MATKKSNRSLWVMLALIAAIVAVILLLPACGNRNPKKAAAEADDTTLVKAGQTAPDFTVEMFDGERITLSSLRGKVVLVNFWATWCPPCREELKHVQTEVIDRFAGRPFVFLPISRGETRDAVAAFRQKTGYTFPMGLDPSRTIYDRYATNSIPRNFLIGTDGKVILQTVGYEPKEFRELIDAIDRALGQ